MPRVTMKRLVAPWLEKRGRYQVAARLEDAFEVLLGAQAEIEINAWVSVDLIATIFYVSNVLDRALLYYTDQE